MFSFHKFSWVFKTANQPPTVGGSRWQRKDGSWWTNHNGQIVPFHEGTHGPRALHPSPKDIDPEAADNDYDEDIKQILSGVNLGEFKQEVAGSGMTFYAYIGGGYIKLKSEKLGEALVDGLRGNGTRWDQYGKWLKGKPKGIQGKGRDSYSEHPNVILFKPTDWRVGDYAYNIKEVSERIASRKKE